MRRDLNNLRVLTEKAEEFLECLKLDNTPKKAIRIDDNYAFVKSNLSPDKA